MAVVLNDEGDILGWSLIDLGDGHARRAYYLCERLGLNVDDFIDEAIGEKVDREEAGQISS